MELIILHDGMYQLHNVTMEMVAGEVWKDCFDLCGILREKLAVFKSETNQWLIGQGKVFFGCTC
jgi:hypothetical protein